ncbi:hypothetical protein EI94DRAFT_1802333 [Lactarius quietus]|nr:hypothetical protein EI94DRAFT_1802333 [Lactarius quietus]
MAAAPIAPFSSSPPLSESSSFSDLGSPSSDADQSNSLPPTTPPIPAEAKVPISLTNFNGSSFAATEAIKWLLQVIGRDVVSFRRNTHVSYLVVERARDIVNTINEYIARVENSTTGDWESFEKFSEAIEPLEEILFKLLLFTEDEKTRYFGSDHTIAECVTSTVAWATNREQLSETLKSFDTREPLVNLFDQHDAESRERERQEALTHDDQFPKYVVSAVAPLDTLQTQMLSGSLPEWLTVITIKTCMLVQGVLEIILQPGTNPKVLDHLKSKPVWKAMTALTKALINVNKGLSAVPDDVKSRYDEFLKILQELSGLDLKLPDSYVNILKEAGRVRRPFQAQAFALVMLCRFLADYFTKIENKSSVTIENAFNETFVVLQAAAKAVTQLSIFDMTDFEVNDTAKEFEIAESVIKESFTSFGLSDEWSKKANVRKEAWEKDKSRMDQLNKVLKKPQSSRATVVKVNISIYDKSSGTELCNTSVSEETTTRLLALRWTAASALPDVDDVKRARTTGFFRKLATNEVIELQNTIAEIAEGKDEVDLKLLCMMFERLQVFDAGGGQSYASRVVALEAKKLDNPKRLRARIQTRAGMSEPSSESSSDYYINGSPSPATRRNLPFLDGNCRSLTMIPACEAVLLKMKLLLALLGLRRLPIPVPCEGMSLSASCLYTPPGTGSIHLVDPASDHVSFVRHLDVLLQEVVEQQNIFKISGNARIYPENNLDHKPRIVSSVCDTSSYLGSVVISKSRSSRSFPLLHRDWRQLSPPNGSDPGGCVLSVTSHDASYVPTRKKRKALAIIEEDFNIG